MRYRYSQNKDGKTERKALVYSREEHHINLSDIDTDVVSICKMLQGAGHETYIVGGAVRDLLIARKPKDFDIATSARPPDIRRKIRNSRLIGRRFKLIHVFFGAKIIEVATFRSTKEGTTGNAFGSIEEDVMRRDFTMNALFYDPVKELVIDYVGGLEDIRQKQVKPLIPLGVIFKDDPVRMIRAVKYAAIAGWPLPAQLSAKVQTNAALLKTISASRLTEEISKILKSPFVAAIIESLEDHGLFAYLQPNAAELCRKDKQFRACFFDTLRGPDAGTSPALRRLIADYAGRQTDWQLAPGADAGELYKAVFAKVRAFVLPMNPPRLELDRALREIFTEHGITVKKTRFSERLSRRRGGRS